MQRYEKIPTVRMKTTNFIHRHWIMASPGLATDTRRTVCQGFVTAATNYRACCHELSHQLPRNIVPIATNDAQGMLTEPKDCLFETARTFSANSYQGGGAWRPSAGAVETLSPPPCERGEPSPHNECTLRRASHSVFQSMHPMQGRPSSSSFFAPLRDKKKGCTRISIRQHE